MKTFRNLSAPVSLLASVVHPSNPKNFVVVKVCETMLWQKSKVIQPGCWNLPELALVGSEEGEMRNELIDFPSHRWWKKLLQWLATAIVSKNVGGEEVCLWNHDVCFSISKLGWRLLKVADPKPIEVVIETLWMRDMNEQMKMAWFSWCLLQF